MAKLVLDEPKKPRLVLDEPPDFGMIAIPRKELPGVWKYDKQLDDLLGDPDTDIEDFLPLDVRYDFGRIVGMTEKPDETKDKMKKSLYYSVQFGIPPKISYDHIEYFMDRTKFNPLKAEQEERGFFGKVAESWRRGDAQVMGDIGVYEAAFEGLGDEEQALAALKKIQLEQALDPIEGNFLADLVYSGVEVLPGMARGYWEAIPKAFAGMATGAGMALAAGQVPPLTLAPEEVGTVPAGILTGGKFGLMAGSAMFWYKQGAGSMYAAMRENDYNPELSKHIAGAAAVPYAIVEFMQVSKLTPGLRRGALNVAQKSMLRVVANATKKYGTVWSAEVFEEVVQEIIQIGAEDMSGYLSDKLKLPKDVGEFLLSRGRRVWETTKEAGKSMALLPIPGATIDIYTGKRAIIPERPTILGERLVVSEVEPVEVPTMETLRGEARETIIQQEQRDRMFTLLDYEISPQAEAQLSKGYRRENKAQAKARIIPILANVSPELPEDEQDAVAERVIEDLYVWAKKEKTFTGEAGINQLADTITKEVQRTIAIRQMPEEELYKTLRVTKTTSPDFKPLYDEVIRRKEAEAPPTEAIAAPEKPTEAITPEEAVEVAKPPAAEAKVEITPEKGFATYKQMMPHATEQEIVVAMAEDGIRPPTEMLKKYEDLPVIERILGQDEIDRAVKRAAIAKPTAKAEPAKVEKKEVLGLTAEEQKEYKRLKEIESIMTKKGLGAIAKESYEAKEVIRLEEKMALAKAEEPKKTKLRQQIGAVVAKKGLTKKALEDLKKKHTGYRHLTGELAKKKITLEQLQNLLKAVQKAHPKQVGYKKVITRKTEKKIQSLKENLIKKTQMTEEHFKDILEKEVHGKEPKYIDAKSFITETEGKDILRRMLDTAEIVRLTESFEQAIAKNDEISKQVKSLDSRIEKAPKRDPYSLESMRYYNQQAEIKTGAPIFTSYMDLMDTHLEITKTRTATMKRLEKATAKFKDIAKDEKALNRVSDYIAAQSTLEDRPDVPTDITTEEKKLAKEIQKILEEYRLKVRVAKFYNWYYYNQPIPDHDRYKREITKAVDIYESKGREELIEYLDTQEWGVIKSGYEPLEILFHKIRPYTTGPTAVGKGHIKIRTDIEYHRQERNILQRLSAYMRQIDMLYNLSPKINAYVRLYDDNASKFKEWGKVKNDIEIFLRNLKRYNIEGGFFERMIARAYSQAMRTIIMPSPVLSFRNLFQNAAFEHDKSILIDPRNKPLSNERIEYLETYVLQTRGMVEEYFMVGEKPLPMLKTLTKLIDKVKLYPHSDIANRHWSFWAKTNQVDRAVKSETIKQMMTEAKFEDMTELEQRRALGILARDGKEAMNQYVGRVHVDDIHFLYERAQRSPAEMTSLGKVIGNLMLFPRAYGEKLAHATNKMLNGKTYEEQWRGLKTIFAVVSGGLIVGSIYMKVTGRKRNPYDPLEILTFRPGGLAWGSIEAVSEVYANILSAAKGDSRALAALTVAIPRAADMFIPFYDYTLRAIEAATDQKNIDRKALRQMRMMIDKKYKIRGGAYKVKRNALEKWQYFLSGPSAEKEEKKVRPKKITR